jgi:hypothetical protein
VVPAISVSIHRDVHVADNDNAAAVRTSEVGVTLVKAFGKYGTFCCSGKQTSAFSFES